MRRLLFTTQQTSSLKAVRNTRHELVTVLRSAVSSESLREKINLLLSESLTNLVAHQHPPAKKIVTKFGKDADQWWLEICDDGPAWNPLAETDESPISNFELEEGGRGIALMRSLSDQISYHSDQYSNYLRMAWNIPDQRHRPCVLIVDDDHTQCRLFEAYLSENYDVLVAHDGEQALFLLRKEKIDLVLSDIHMPGMTGFTLRARLEHSNENRLVPFVFLSGDHDDTIMQKALEMGVDDFLAKPTNKATLNRVIERVLERSRQVKKTLSERLDKNITSALSNRPPPSHGDWRITSFSTHTGRGGGDFMLHHTQENHLQLILADTMGHDDSAKFFSHAYAGYLRGFMYACSAVCGPEILIKRLSYSAWQDQLFSSVTLTCVAAFLSPGGQMEIASAGHPPALLVSPKGIREIDTVGILPGLVENADYESLSLTLQPGERLALYTDGLFEAVDNALGRSELETEVRRMLEATVELSISQALSAVQALFERLTGNAPTDDATLILIERSA